MGTAREVTLTPAEIALLCGDLSALRPAYPEHDFGVQVEVVVAQDIAHSMTRFHSTAG
jgi:hypothetical protein